jgi:hypothetical protein
MHPDPSSSDALRLDQYLGRRVGEILELIEIAGQSEKLREQLRYTKADGDAAFKVLGQVRAAIGTPPDLDVVKWATRVIAEQRALRDVLQRIVEDPARTAAGHPYDAERRALLEEARALLRTTAARVDPRETPS